MKKLGIRIGRRALKGRKELWKSEVRGDEDKVDSQIILSRATFIEMSADEL